MNKLKSDFGVRALLAVMTLTIFGAVVIPLALKGDTDTLKTAAAIVAPLAMAALTYYYSARGQAPPS